MLVTFPAVAASPRRPYGDADADADVHIDGDTDDVDAWDPHFDDVSDIVVECCCHLGYMLFVFTTTTKKEVNKKFNFSLAYLSAGAWAEP